MRILHVFHGGNLVNGVDRATLALSEALHDEGVAVHALVPESGSVLSELERIRIPVEVAPLDCCVSLAPRARLKFLAAAGRRTRLIEELLARWRIDLVHANTGHLVDAALAAAQRGLPLLWHIHSPLEVDHARYAPYLDCAGYGALLGALSSRVVTVSEDMRRSLAQQVPPDRLAVIPNGVDVGALEAVAKRPGVSIRDELGLPPTAPLILGVGRVSAQKDFATFVKVAAVVARSQPHAHFLIAGPLEEPPAVAALREAISESHLEDRVHLLGARTDIPRLLRETSAVLSTAVFEGQGLSTIEAMALGRPVVAMACVGLRECLSNEEDGLLVPAGDVPAAADAILRVLTDRALAGRLGEAARSTVERRFSLASFGKSFLDLAVAACNENVSASRVALVPLARSLLAELGDAEHRVRRYEGAGKRRWLDQARRILAS